MFNYHYEGGVIDSFSVAYVDWNDTIFNGCFSHESNSYKR